MATPYSSGALQTADALRRAISRLHRRIRAERPVGGLTLLGWRVLADVGRLGPETATAMAFRDGIKVQSLTRIVALLDARKLIRKERDPADRRSWRIELTAKGRAQLTRESEHRNEWLAKAIGAMLGADERTAIAAAGALLERLSTFEEGADT
jgi:DNA-binding MarR family transcriptional regulator